MKQFFIFWIIAFGVSALANQEINLDKSGVILQGYDVVSYFTAEQPQLGDAKINTNFQGATYNFSSEKNKSEFLTDPKKYAPQYGGWCAYAVADSKSKVDIDPRSYLVQDGRLFLFYNGLWGNTRQKWSKEAKDYLKKADANWPEVEHKEP